MRDLCIYIDEFGNTNIETEKSGVSTFFILTAVLIPVAEVVDIRQAVEEIRKRFFQTGEMKSSKIGKDDQKRVDVLEALTNLNFKTYSVAVDKRELSRESGLVYKKSFFKYINRILYERLYRSYENVDVVADEHGRDEFMAGFVKYIDSELRPSLFARRTFKFQSSSAEPLLQVADLFSGSLARSLEPNKISSRSDEMQKLIAKCSMGITVWPPRRLPKPEKAGQEGGSDHDDIVRDHCFRLAHAFLEKSNRHDDETRIQVDVLEFLLFNAQFVDPSAFISTQKIVDHLRDNVGIEVSDYRLRVAGIAPLRDADVIIASSPKGYKVPVCAADIRKFVEHANTIVPPMLARLNRARDEIKLVTMGGLDILAADEHQHLRTLLDIKW